LTVDKEQLTSIEERIQFNIQCSKISNQQSTITSLVAVDKEQLASIEERIQFNVQRSTFKNLKSSINNHLPGGSAQPNDLTH